MGEAKAALERVASSAPEAALLARQASLKRKVHSVCASKTATRVALPRWVLAAELERMADIGNVHLSRMSEGRYTIRRCDASSGGGRGARGLDLEVLDAHTGRARDASTLSGGEQFLASLSLALGLADIASQGGRAAGHVYEMLILDEGFGTLDPDALDKAIEAVDHVQASGRTVGIITHVAEVKQRVSARLEVTRTPSGGSTLKTSV